MKPGLSLKGETSIFCESPEMTYLEYDIQVVSVLFHKEKAQITVMYNIFVQYY